MKPPAAPHKPPRWLLPIGLAAAAGSAIILGFLLALATRNSARFEAHYDWLIAINVGIATLLLLVIVGAAVQLVRRLRRGRFGSRLLMKLAATFALVGVAPGLVIYTVSYQFVTRSIESWFDVQVEGALESGLAFARSAFQEQMQSVGTRTRQAAERLSEQGGAQSPLELERLRVALDADAVAVVTEQGQILTQVSGEGAQGGISLRRPQAAWIRLARGQRVWSQLEGLDDEAGSAEIRIRVLALMPSTRISLTDQDRLLYVLRTLPRASSQQALAVQAAYQEYQERMLGRLGLQRMYIGTLTLTLILAVFGALILAFSIARQLAQPLLVLAQGMEEVAAGNLQPKLVLPLRDELGGLTRSFADMTLQLADARQMVQKSVEALDGSRIRLQTILDNLSSGVLVVNAQGALATVNPGAERILRLPLTEFLDADFQAAPGLTRFAQIAIERFKAQEASARARSESGEREPWQDVIEWTHEDGEQLQTLLVRGAWLPEGAWLLVFDDITEVVSAQRSQAWAEVARRLAHEIKNPLTPIQLSAERLTHKLADKLQGTDRAMLERAVQTIVKQVQAMKSLVDEFRDYSRLPSAKLAALDLNALAQDTLALYTVPMDSGRLSVQLEPGLPRLLGDASQLRQVIHNLVQNALDATESDPQGHVLLSTAQVQAESGAVAVRLRVSDNGPGFDPAVLARAFEPYVTTKAKGTGLGLAVVRKILDDHGATIRLSARRSATEESPHRGGAQVSISFHRLAEGPLPG